MATKLAPIVIEEKLVWSNRCQEHFLPWRIMASESESGTGIAEAGISDTFPGYELGRLNSRFHLLVYPTQGEGEFFWTGGEGQVKTGELLLVPQGYSFGYKPVARRWRFLWFHLMPTEHWEQIAQRGIRVRRTLVTESLDRAMDGFLSESRKRSKLSQKASALYSSLMTLFIEHDVRHGLNQYVVDSADQLAMLWEIVNTDLAHSWSVNELARRLGVSRAHLHRLTLEHDGMSPMKMVTRLRMEKAQELLVLHDNPVRVIAAMVGYTDEFAFSVAFKRFSGSTPGMFRRRR